jgi:subtilisin family serine protease
VSRNGLLVWTCHIAGFKTQTNYDPKIKNSSDSDPDVYGHGTQVASIAAGRSITGAPESAGIASNANIYDVRVLDDTGVGQIGDVLAGIDWVIYHSKDYNIRVLNLSLAADSTESFRTDPLCRRARCDFVGLTVVVAAGNWQGRYGPNSSAG